MSDDDYFTQSLETAMMKVATLGMQKEAMRENIANLQTSFFLQLDITKAMLEEKEAMLKHITDLEEALTELNNDWLAGNDMDEAFTKHFKKFFYLRAQSKAVHDTQQDDDGYEPPEHMTADDFNEMHSGPYQPDDTGYMDGDYE